MFYNKIKKNIYKVELNDMGKPCFFFWPLNDISLIIYWQKVKNSNTSLYIFKNTIK